MKINEVAIREANYETSSRDANLAAIGVKLGDLSNKVTDVNLQLALSKIAYELEYFGQGPRYSNSIQDILDKINQEGKFIPDMPQDNKNPIKLTKETLMKIMKKGQDLVNKEGTTRPDIAEDTEDREKINAGKMRKRLTDLRFDVADIEANIGELRHLDNGDLTDQVSTMMKYSAGLYSVLTRAMKIVPVYEMNESERSPAMIAKIKKWHDELEDNNHHGEAALLLVNAFGGKEELDIITAINARHKKRGSIMRSEQQLRDEIANQYYKMLTTNEGVISDLFTTTTDEKRQKQRTGDAYDAMKVDKETRKFEKQGLSSEDARKYAYRKVHGKPLGEGKLSVNKIHKAVDSGKSMDTIVGMFADKGTTNTDDIRKIVKDYKFKSRMKK